MSVVSYKQIASRPVKTSDPNAHLGAKEKA